jgi:hypothetical protein
MIQKCTNCQLERKIVYGKEIEIHDATKYVMRICEDCSIRLLTLCFDHLQGSEFDFVVKKFGEPKP